MERERETAESIKQWADDTFGPAPRLAQLQRAAKEMSELQIAILTDADEKTIAMEAADVIICLSRLAALYPYAVDEKMAINRAGKCVVYGSGFGQNGKGT